MKTIVLFFCSCIILFGCSKTTKVDISKDIKALRLIEDQWVEAARAGDIDKILDGYAPTSVDMAYNIPVSLDNQARRKAIESWLKTIDLKSMKNTTDDIQVSSSGDLAFTRGTSYQKSSDGLIEYSGRWVSIYKKINENWKVIVNIDHNDSPRPLRTETSKGLNQVELMKQFLGKWSGEMGKDTTYSGEIKMYGTGMLSDVKTATKGKTIMEGHTIIGYDSKTDKYTETDLVKGYDVTIYSLWFDSKTTCIEVPYQYALYPENAPVIWKYEFKPPDIMVWNFISNNKTIGSYTFHREK
jgi:ketosteroid isomerase-like protein